MLIYFKNKLLDVDNSLGGVDNAPLYRISRGLKDSSLYK